jgi:hypothetical protein
MILKHCQVNVYRMKKFVDADFKRETSIFLTSYVKVHMQKMALHYSWDLTIMDVSIIGINYFTVYCLTNNTILYTGDKCVVAICYIQIMNQS